MSAEETKKELELQSKITEQILLQTKSKRELAVGVAQANQEYQNNLAILKAQNAEIQKYDRSIQVSRDNSAAMYRANTQGAASSSSAFDALGGTLRAFNDEMFNAAARLEDLSAERRELTNEIARSIGGSSRLFNELATDAANSAEMIGAINENVVGKMRRYYQDFGNVAGTAVGNLKEAQLEFIGQVNSTDSSFARAQSAMDEFYRNATGFKKGDGGKLVPDSFFMVQGVPLMDVMGGTKQAFQPFLDILKDETLQQPFGSKMLDPDNMEKSLRDLKRIDVAMLGLGIRSDQVTELVRTNYIRSGEASTDYFSEVVKAAEIGQNAFGYNAQMIVGDIIKMTQNIDVFGFRSGDEFAKIASRAKDLHMTIADLQGAMGKFDTFESAAQTVGQLNAALGTNLDAFELMTLKYEDPALMLEKLREGLLSTGKSFDEIPITYKRMVTQQLGITMEGLRGLMDGNVRSLDEMTAQQEAARDKLEGGLKPDQAQAAFDLRLEARVKEATGLVKSSQDISAMAERAAKVFAQNGVAVSNMAEKTSDSLKILAKEYTGAVAPAIVEITKAVKYADQIFTKAAAESARQAIIEPKFQAAVQQAITSTVTSIMSQLEKVLKDVFKLSPQQIQDLKDQKSPTPGTTQVQTRSGQDVVMKGELDEGDRVILSNYGSILRSTLIDKRDTLVASPPASEASVTTTENVAAAPPRLNLPAASDAVRASLQSVGSSLRIELDVGQLTDLVLRDIMMNKPNVFGGIG